MGYTEKAFYLVEQSGLDNPQEGNLALYNKSGQITVRDSSGSESTISNSLVDPMTTRGDIIVRDATNTTARLGLGAMGEVLKSDGNDIVYSTLTSSDVGLGNVDNIADANQTSLGTVTTGNVDAVVSNATTLVAGKVELATSGETDNGVDTTLATTPGGIAASYVGTKTISVMVEADGTDLATGDGLNGNFIRIPEALDSMVLYEVGASVGTAGTTGTTDIQIHNVTQAVDMLSTVITIDSGETDSTTAATQPIIDGNNDDVFNGDKLRIDVDAISTTAPQGLVVTLSFRKE